MSGRPTSSDLPQGVGAVDAADVVDFGAGDGLAVGDDGEHFEAGAVEPLRLPLEEHMHVVCVGSARSKLPAACDRYEVEAAALCLEPSADAFEERLNALGLDNHLFDSPNDFGEFDEGEGSLCGEEDSLKHGAEVCFGLVCHHDNRGLGCGAPIRGARLRRQARRYQDPSRRRPVRCRVRGP